MNARSDIARLLQQWLQFSQAEAVAIETAVWTNLKDIQARKAELQISLDEAKARWSQENSGRRFETSHPFRSEVARLLSLETQNSELLARQLERARAEQKSVDEAHRNLRKIHRSYAHAGTVAGWNSYS